MTGERRENNNISSKQKNKHMETTTTVLNVIGWICLMASWIIPAVIKHKSESINANKHIVGMLLGAVALGFFASALVVSMVK